MMRGGQVIVMHNTCIIADRKHLKYSLILVGRLRTSLNSEDRNIANAVLQYNNVHTHNIYTHTDRDTLCTVKTHIGLAPEK